MEYDGQRAQQQHIQKTGVMFTTEPLGFSKIVQIFSRVAENTSQYVMTPSGIVSNIVFFSLFRICYPTVSIFLYDD